MKHFLVVTNNHKDPEYKCTEFIRTYLVKHECICDVDTNENLDMSKISERTECIIVLGGDGTLLRAARATIAWDIPLIGVNLGTLGYLAEVESNKIEYALKRLMEDNFSKEQRMMLRGCKQDANYEQSFAKEIKKNVIKSYALNDIAIVRHGSLQMIQFHIYVNGQLLNTYYADGILIATPTGSTGYNLSAGGPIVEPKADIILLTPICPHTLNTRTIILAPDDIITVEIAENKRGREQEVEACFDGSDRIIMHIGDKMEIARSSRKTEIIKLSRESFLEVLHKKMNIN